MQLVYLYDAIMAHKVSCNFLETSGGTLHVEVSGLVYECSQCTFLSI